MEITLSSLVDINAGKYPDYEAVIFDHARVNYSQLSRRMNMRANALLDLGIEKGDHVAVMASHCMELTETLLSIWRIGAVFVPLNYRNSPEEIVYVIEHSEATSLIFLDEYEETVTGMKSSGIQKVGKYLCLGKSANGGFIDFNKHTLGQSDNPPAVKVSGSDLACIIYTAGTTGRSKGVLLTHKNLVLGAISVALSSSSPFPEGSPAGFKDKLLFSGPFFHIGGVLNFIHVLLDGGSIVLQKKFDPTESLSWIEKEKVNRLQGVATLYNLLIMTPNLDNYDLTSVLRLGSGAETMPDETRERLKKLFPNAQIGEGYGMTESAGIIAIRNPEDTAEKPYSVGLPASLVEVKIVDELGRELGPNEVGEIIVRGANTMEGYYKDPEKTADALRDGWLWTHDLGRKDEDGFLYVVERKNDMIKSGGENIYPKEIEDILYRHEKIAEAAVFGVPDPVWGQNVYAAVVLEKDREMSEEEVISFCKENLASFKKPKRVIFKDTLPRSPVGKILRKNLRSDYSN